MGTLGAVPVFVQWLLRGQWFMVAAKLGVAFMATIAVRSLWYRMADGQDKSPLTTTGLVAMGLVIMLSAIVAHSMGFWSVFRRIVLPN